MTELTAAELQAQIAQLQQQLAQLQNAGARDVVTGDKPTAFDQRYQQIAQQINVKGGMTVYTGAAPTDAAEAWQIYRAVVARACGRLPLRGVDLGASDADACQQPLGLASVYIDLNTTTQVPVAEPRAGSRERGRGGDEKEMRPLSALAAVGQNRQVVLLGDPGGGKTTFVNHLTYCLASGAPAEWVEWPAAERTALPLQVILRDFARGLSAPLPARAAAQHLWDFIAAGLAKQNLGFVTARAAGQPALLEQVLEAGGAVVLLDGLDEVPTAAQRTFVRDAVAAFADRYPANRYLVTCRVLSYQDVAWQLPGLPVFELAPFDAARIDRFIAAWYAELGNVGTVRGVDVARLTRQLQQAVRRPDLWRLANNPLLLTVMALVHAHKGQLPDARALLYEDTVDILLWRWDQLRGAAPRLRTLLAQAGGAEVDLKRVLWRLAYEAHATVEADHNDGEQLADIPEYKLVKALAALHSGSLDWGREVVQVMKLRAGLLVERAPEVFTFPHRTFQEYLAGAHLAAQADLARRGAELAAAGAAWREVILLAVGRLVYLSGDTDKPLALVGELCPRRGRDDEGSWRQAWLAGAVLQEIGVHRLTGTLGQDLLARGQERLGELVAGGKLAPRERAAAGRVLAGLGDPRDFEELVEVPAGAFLMGSPDADGDADSDEKPQHEVTLPTFKIGKYPVTNGQYAAFVAATGRAWRSEAGQQAEYANAPAVEVSWYDAVVYCEWLTGVWRETGKIAAAEAVRLPSEAEWEKAARGPDGRIWSWGNEWDELRCNNRYLDINSTSAVGMFPGGVSPYGCLDLLGNVWEWTRSLWGKNWQEPDFKYPYDAEDGREDLTKGADTLRVVRGGAFHDRQSYVRCAVRDGYDPASWDNTVGFRVVVSPVSRAAGL